MVKVGILFGQENTFPQAFTDRVNQKNIPGIMAEFVSIDKVMQGSDSGYGVILDRISQDVPFYRAYLKNAAASGTAVINNPFWWSADDKFFNNALAKKLGIQVPRTALLPSREQPDNTTPESFRNLVYPFDWQSIFEYVGFPAFMKPYNGGGWRDVYRVEDREEFFRLHAETGQQVMMLQEEIDFSAYYRCYCIGGKYVRIMPYDPRQPHHLRYKAQFRQDPEMLELIEHYVRSLNQHLGYDFNTVEIAIRGDVPFAIDFYNPAPDAELLTIGEDHFEWVVEMSANYAIERALAYEPNRDNLTWGRFVQEACMPPKPAKKKKAGTAKKSTAKKQQKAK